MTRLVDRLIRRDAGFWEGQASGAALFATSYGSPDKEQVLPGFAAAAQHVYGGNGVVFAAILARIMMLSEARFQFQRISDKNLFGDPRLRILERPWPDGNAGELIARCEQDASLAGSSYTWDAGDQLVRWRPDWVTIISEVTQGPRGPYRRKIGYHYEPPPLDQPAFGGPQTVPASEVAHWAPLPDPVASFRGMSWMTPVLRDAQADTAMNEYKIRYLENAASPNLLIKYAQRLQPGTVDSIRERVHARYGGSDNAFRTLILDQGADATVIGANLSQMDFSGVQQAGADRVLAASFVPGVIVGLEPLRGAGRGYQESMRKFADLWGRPTWRSLCGCLQKLTPGADIDAGAVRLWYDTSGVAALQEGEQEKAQIGLIHAQGLLTLRQAGYSRESAVAALTANDLTLLKPDPNPLPVQGQGQQSQHMLPQPPGSGPAPGLEPLPEGATPRLPSPPGVSPGSKGRATVPGRRVAAVRRP